MFKATLKSIRGHIGRTIATAAAVILGISFLAGTLIFTDSIQRAFDDLFATVFETTDASVRSTDVIDAGFGLQVRSRIDESLVETVAAVDGVASAEGFVQGTATVVDSEGEPIGNPGQGPPTFGFSWGDDEELNQFTMSDGRPPAAPGEVVLDESTAELGGYTVGDQVGILAASGAEQFELVGVARFGTSGSVGGSTTALFEIAEAQRVLGVPGKIDAISIRANDGVSEDEIVARISEALTGDVEVISGTEATEEAQSAIAEGLSFFNIFLLVFALVALFVSMFVIFNTFSILIAQRTREFALFRALGASRGQVVRSVFFEALIVGLVGSLLGVGLGILLSFGLRAMLAGFGIELPSGGLVLALRTIILSLVLGTLVTIVASLFPAIRASRITPIEALREASAETWQRNTLRVIIGLLVVAASAVLILFGLLAPEIALAGLGVGLMFVGVIVLGPTIARPVSRLLGFPIAQAGLTGKLARDNSMRNPKRTARTAAALTIGIALVAGITVLFSSLTKSIEDTVAEGFFGDVVVDSGSFGPGGGFSPELAASVRELDEVAVAATIRVGVGELEGQGDFFLTFDQGGFEVFDVGLIEGTTELVGEQILLYENKAEDLGVGLGDTVSVKLPDGLDRDLEVVGIYDDAAVANNQVISHELYATTGAEQLDFAIYVQMAEGTSVADGRAAIETVAAPYANAEILDKDEFVESQSAQLDPLLGLITGLLALAIVIAAFGIANTLRLSTIERTREIGLLRAVGMTQRQVRSTIRWEAVITAVFGSLLGVLLGVFLGWAVIRALRDQGVSSFSVPIASLAFIVLAGAIVGLLASIVPAFRASKLNILEAIAA